MTNASVRAHTRDATIDILLDGEVDLANCDEVQRQIFEAIGNHLVSVRVDLSGLTYVDSAGLRILFALAERLRLLQTECTLIAPLDSPIRRVIELSGLASVVDVRA